MSKPSIGIVVPFFNTPMWIQTSLYGLIQTTEKYKDKYDIEILVMDNAAQEGGRSLKKSYIDAVLNAPELADKVTTLLNTEDIAFHGTALDTAVRYFNTDYLICWESDIAIYNDNWLDWMMTYIDDGTWMAGYEFTDYSNSRDTIVWYVMPNPGIYKLDILKTIDNEVRANKDYTYYFGENYCSSQVVTPNYAPGVFSERRGFKEPHPNCPDGKGKLARPHPEYYENGQWLFYKILRDYPELNYKVLDQHRQVEHCNGELTPMYSAFGDNLFRHHWAGTRSWDFLIHEESNCSQINYVREKINIEIAAWKSIVPKHIRAIIPDVFNACRNDEFEYTNLRHIHDNNLGNPAKQALSLDIANWYKREFLDRDFMNLLDD